MTQGGPQAVQVFSDFEHVFTKFKHADGGRTMGTSDLLESSGAISNDAIEQIRQITEEFDKLDDVQDEQSFFDMSARCQAAVARHGSLHIGNVPVVTR